MRYTNKKISGLLCLLLAAMIITRVAPDWLFYSLVAAITVLIAYLLYNSSRFW